MDKKPFVIVPFGSNLEDSIAHYQREGIYPEDVDHDESLSILTIFYLDNSQKYLRSEEQFNKNFLAIELTENQINKQKEYAMNIINTQIRHMDVLRLLYCYGINQVNVSNNYFHELPR